jgi:hypothetical protein
MKHSILWIFVLMLAAPMAAWADKEQEPSPKQMPDTFTSPIRGQCEGDLRKDHTWRAQLEEELRNKVHQDDADLMATNKKHVVMAYAALWIIVVLFVVFMWIRQTDLKKQIAGLESDLAAAEADDA